MNLQNLVDYCRDFGLPDPFSGANVPAPLNLDAVKSAIMIRCGLLTPIYGEPDVFTNMTTHWFLTKQWTFEHLINVIQAEYSPIENVYENRKETTIYGSSEIHTGGFKDTDSGKDTDTHSDHDTTERTYTNYHDSTERTHTNYHDTTERTYTNYHDDTERTHTNYKEANTKTGNTVRENEVSAYNANTYQPSEKNTETYNQVKDEKSITGSYKDAETISGSYKDDETITGSYKDDETITGSYKDDTTYGHKITMEHGKSTTRTYQNDKQDHVGKDTFEVFRHGNIGVTTNQQMINEELELLRHFDVYGFIADLFENDMMLMIY